MPSQPASRPSGRKIQAETVTGRNYQVPVLAEFLGAILLVSVTPIATKQEQDGLSPYAGSDILKIGALTVLYLILAAVTLAGRGAGRLAAWFGGLILLVVGLNEAANIAKDLDIFGTAGGKQNSAQEGTANAAQEASGGSLTQK